MKFVSMDKIYELSDKVGSAYVDVCLIDNELATERVIPIEVLYELQEEISKLESGWYWRSVSENGVTSFDKDPLSYVHKLIDEKIKELSK